MSDPKNILIVEDDRQLAFGVSRRLQAAGYSTRTAEDGQLGIESATQRRPDVILMDVMMPNVDGMTALHRLRADVRTEKIPVVMLSASLADEQTALDAGARFFLKKPYGHDQLFAAVERAMEMSDVRVESDS